MTRLFLPRSHCLGFGSSELAVVRCREDMAGVHPNTTYSGCLEAGRRLQSPSCTCRGLVNLKIIPWSALPYSTALTKELHPTDSPRFHLSWCFWPQEPSHESTVLVERLLPLFSFYLEQSRKGTSGVVCTSAEVEPGAAIRKGSGKGSVHVAVFKLSALMC